jgi:hypothetical protein
MNSMIRGDAIPMDFAPLIVSGIVSLLFALAFVLVPLRFSQAGREPWPRKYESIAYFACLGAGFIILELVFMQLFMKLIGYPLYTVATVLFVMLFAAGVGSLTSHRLGIGPGRRWQWPFIGILTTGSLLLAFHQAIFDLALAAPLLERVLLGAALIFPLGFMLGMPFPLGILAVQDRSRGAVAWAWGINGAFTLIGGLLSSVLALAVGFRFTIGLGLGIYLVAFLLFGRIAHARRGSDATPRAVPSPAPAPVAEPV